MNEALLEEIEVVRQQMVELGLEKGLSDPETVSRSQELDELLNRLNRKEKTKCMYS